MYSRAVLLGSCLYLVSAGCVPGDTDGPGGGGTRPPKADAAASPPPPAGGQGPGGSAGGATAGTGGTSSGGDTGGTGGGASPGTTGGTGGAGGSSAATPPVTNPPGADASPSGEDAAPATDAVPATPRPDTGNYTCTRIIGINATAEWFNAGFESMVDNARWELVRVHSGFVDLWANPASAFWNTNPTSPCASKMPDRVIFVGLRFEWTSTEQWTTALTGVVKNIKDKFPGVKRIELASFVRAPGNKACPQRPAPRSTIHPSMDEAIAKVVATDPALLLASPKFEVSSCSDFSGNPPHFSATGGRKVAMTIAQHYGAGAK